MNSPFEIRISLGMFGHRPTERVFRLDRRSPRREVDDVLSDIDTWLATAFLEACRCDWWSRNSGADSIQSHQSWFCAGAVAAASRKEGAQAAGSVPTSQC